MLARLMEEESSRFDGIQRRPSLSDVVGTPTTRWEEPRRLAEELARAVKGQSCLLGICPRSSLWCRYHHRGDWRSLHASSRNPVITQIDPCNYALAMTLVVMTAAAAAEAAVHYLITGEKRKTRRGFREVLP